MSGVDFLVKLLDGSGVEWQPLEQIAKIKHGKDWKGLNSGDIPVYGSGGIMGYVDEYSYNKPTVLIPRKGSITNIFYVETPFWNVDTIYYTDIDVSKVIPKYLYHFVKTIDLMSLDTGSGRPSLTQAILNKILVPIPCQENPEKSLEIQGEIVRILDAFTVLTAELTAELTARKKQYHYYRDQLLSFEEGDVVWKTLGDLVDINTGSKPPEILEIATSFDYINAGTSRSGYSAASNCVGDTVTTPSRGQGGIGYVGYQRESFWLGPLCYKLQSIDKTVLINKYLFYFLQSRSELLLGLKKEGGVPAVNKSDLVKLEMPVPLLEVQQRIVAILDKFDALTNSITEGLPREIELRQRQYAYYRDLLLNFPKPEEVEA
ncbi:restriction endonuclease subunit S [Methylicorpusculum sp.]|uniref:restriction endonuclease subunit S n=1 Tax=Methylicorpusculum sp. TaxID=2713644 RepID=UPI00272812C7|nr:restriction endonuclease subunit S [Methylicorpusculum sp.]MDO8842800.1 restriction endonuclease subunit S [Methylicorpusculum sp.]